MYIEQVYSDTDIGFQNFEFEVCVYSQPNNFQYFRPKLVHTENLVCQNLIVFLKLKLNSSRI